MLKKYIFLIISLILFGSSLCKIPEDISDLLGGHTLKVGTTGDYKPFSFFNKESNEYEGIDVELITSFAEQHYVKIEYVPTTWSTLLEDLENGKFHIAMCGISSTKDRLEKGIMSKPYIKTGKAFLIRKKDIEKFKSIEDINQPGVKIISNDESTNLLFGNTFLEQAEKTINKNTDEIPKKISNGEADVMITDLIGGLSYLSEFDDLAVPLDQKALTNEPVGVLVEKENTALLDWINLFIEGVALDGTVDELINNYIQGVK